MSKVKAEISMSLDGYVDAAGVSMEAGLGLGGEVLHEWGQGDDVDEPGARAVQGVHDVGALICGRRTYDLSVQFWGANGPTGPEQRVPVFVLTHSAPDPIPADGVYQFVQGELAEVLARAQDAAGDGGVSILGGANAIQQFLSAGLVDELHLHLVPVLFGAGTRVFDLDLPNHLRLAQDHVDVSPNAIHLVYRVRQ
jgi:dihydrofolate reductase